MLIASVIIQQQKEGGLLVIDSVLRRKRTTQHFMLSEQGEYNIVSNQSHPLLSQPWGSQQQQPATDPKQLTISCFIWQHSEALVLTTAAVTRPSQYGSYPVLFKAATKQGQWYNPNCLLINN